MEGNELLQELQARTRKLRAELEVLANEIHAQIQGGRPRGQAITDEDDAETPV